jgi:hypothetical protein
MAYREAEKSEAEKEMDIVRIRLDVLEEAAGLARAWKRVTIGLVAFGLMTVTTTFVAVGLKVKHDKEPCKDTIVEVHVGDKLMSCPNPNHKLENLTSWGLQCMCQR